MPPFFRFKTLAAAILLSGCAPMIDTHGDALDADDLASLKVGETPYTDVARVLGSPSVSSTFDTENWLYITSKQKRTAFFKPVEFERTVTVLKFDRSGILQGIETKTLANGKTISPDRDTTEANGKGLSFFDQMADNVGRLATDAPAH
ncbi:MAG TPA: hypothetical protein DD624_07905 [Alphaproteobacteria bacterium]|nr:hypothetical protein [Alphaproteobacteria bacterium]